MSIASASSKNPQIVRSASLLQEIRKNPSIVSLRTLGGRRVQIFEVALREVPFFQVSSLKAMKNGPKPEELLANAIEKINARGLKILEKSENSRIDRPILEPAPDFAARFCLIPDIDSDKPRSILPGKKIDPNICMEVDFEQFPTDTVAQFVQYQYGKGLPKEFDPISLFKLADYLRHTVLAKEILISKLNSSDPFDIYFGLYILGSTYYADFNDEDKSTIQCFSKRNECIPVVDDFLLRHLTLQKESGNLAASEFLRDFHFAQDKKNFDRGKI